MNEIFKQSLQVSFVIAKLVIPFSILSEILQFYGVIEYTSFIFEPIAQLLNLRHEVAIAFAASFFLNIYAGIAVAAGLSLTPYEWTIVGTFIAICHSIPMESAVLKKVGFPVNVHWLSRLVLGIVGAWFASLITPETLTGGVFTQELMSAQYNGFIDLFKNAVINAAILCVKICVLVSALICMFELIKRSKTYNAYLKKHTYMSSLLVGGLLGVTYGAGILLKDMNTVKNEHKVYLLTFLMLAHGLIEETLIFLMFGSDVMVIFAIRMFIALTAVLSVWLFKTWKYNNKQTEGMIND
ncbi:hypothetical protein L1D16_03870 [Vibrio sp. Isolate31]|uniref:hypothetical protein n=1 Tax=unclassified Vibrio TaxID=2614977 RepID=UPI001EFE4ABF|nr:MULTISPECIES: hypothetical protein [unclassified Vibrio]MCG9554684.1 hypothetical protein [Vibrio sp. Isolate32]MCG9600072.1 hypothetical protein [Vibrio sp. Isolate31]